MFRYVHRGSLSDAFEDIESQCTTDHKRVMLLQVLLAENGYMSSRKHTHIRVLHRPAIRRGTRARCRWQVCQVMEFLAAHGLIHRDLAPRNVMLAHFDPADPSATSVKVAGN